MPYTEQNRKEDFQYYVDHFDSLYEQFGRCFLAIQNKQVLAHAESIPELLKAVTGHALGTFIIQKCFGDESSYTATITRFRLPVSAV